MQHETPTISLNARFASIGHEAQVSIIRTGLMLLDAFEQVLKPHGITGTQFNVLRILRGVHPEGYCRYEIRDRMITRMPDVTRLLDRMEEAGLIARERSETDRRVVRTFITQAGLDLLEAIDDDVRRAQDEPFEDIDESRLRDLVGVLADVRASL
jgi:DNA-binding MarR family transcriptional regulator